MLRSRLVPYTMPIPTLESAPPRSFDRQAGAVTVSVLGTTLFSKPCAQAPTLLSFDIELSNREPIPFSIESTELRSRGRAPISHPSSRDRTTEPRGCTSHYGS